MFPHKRFNALVEETIEKIHELSLKKGGEYAGDHDRLANFRRNAQNLGVPIEIIWAVYAGKHWDAINQYCQDALTKKSRPRMEPIEGRFHDLIVYCILGLAILEERKGELEALDRGG